MSFAQHQTDGKPKATAPSLQPKSALERATQAAAAAKRHPVAEPSHAPRSQSASEAQATEKPTVLGIPPQELTPHVRR
ncbi:MAG: hypothetical protein ACK5XI_02730, partial [Hyphomonadaceae bacterium]